jgi:hypothetical protein
VEANPIRSTGEKEIIFKLYNTTEIGEGDLCFDQIHFEVWSLKRIYKNNWAGRLLVG